jgi:chromosome segregation ATPase
MAAQEPCCTQAECRLPNCATCIAHVARTLVGRDEHFVDLNLSKIPVKFRQPILALVDTNKELASALENLRDQLAAAMLGFDSSKAQLTVSQKALRGARTNLTDLRSASEKLLTENTELINKNAELINKNAELLKANAALLTENAELSAEIPLMKTAMGGARDQLLRMALEKSNVDAGINAVAAEVEIMRKHDAAKSQAIKGAQAQADELRKELTNLNASVAEQLKEKDASVAEQLKEKDARVAKLLEKKDARFAELMGAKDAEFAERLKEKDARFAELLEKKDAEFTERLQKKDNKIATQLQQKEAKIAELANLNASVAEQLQQKDARIAELVEAKDAEFAKRLKEKDASVAKLLEKKEAQIAELAGAKDAEFTERLKEKDAEFTERLKEKDAEFTERLQKKDAKIANQLQKKDTKIAELMEAESRITGRLQEVERNAIGLMAQLESSEAIVLALRMRLCDSTQTITELRTTLDHTQATAKKEAHQLRLAHAHINRSSEALSQLLRANVGILRECQGSLGGPVSPRRPDPPGVNTAEQAFDLAYFDGAMSPMPPGGAEFA